MFTASSVKDHSNISVTSKTGDVPVPVELEN